MGDNPVLASKNVTFFLIFTDLDGTLLDTCTYGWEEAKPALDLCRRLNVPIIFVSSKTRAEIDLFRRKLSISAPFISENGGGIFFAGETINPPPSGASFEKGLWKLPLGIPYTRLVKGLHKIRDELGWNIKGFSDMNINEISHLTGLDQETSLLAAKREYDEPFIITAQAKVDKDILYKAAAKRGLTITEGGRFYHLQGNNDKGQAMEKVLSWYGKSCGKITSIALGDSPNDFPMLERADYPVLIRSKEEFPSLKKKLPHLRVSEKAGPTGWNSVVFDILQTNEEKYNDRQV